MKKRLVILTLAASLLTSQITPMTAYADTFVNGSFGGFTVESDQSGKLELDDDEDIVIAQSDIQTENDLHESEDITDDDIDTEDPDDENDDMDEEDDDLSDFEMSDDDLKEDIKREITEYPDIRDYSDEDIENGMYFRDCVEYYDSHSSNIPNKVGVVCDIIDSASYAKNRFGSTTDAKYDGRQFGLVTIPKDQANTGLCWDFAGTACQETNLILKGWEDNTIDLSELYNAYGVWKYHNFGESETKNKFSDYLCSGGDSSVIQTISAHGYGPIKEEKLPIPWHLEEQETISQGKFNVGVCTVIEEADDLIEGIEEKQNDGYECSYAVAAHSADLPVLKQLIIEYGSFAAAFHSEATGYDFVNMELENNKYDDYTYYLPIKVADSIIPTHEVQVVGWDDNFSKYDFGDYIPSRNGAWLCKNSWGCIDNPNSKNGKAFGSGYFWMSYDTVIGSAIAFDMTKTGTTYDTLKVELPEVIAVGETINIKDYITPIGPNTVDPSYIGNKIDWAVSTSGSYLLDKNGNMTPTKEYSDSSLWLGLRSWKFDERFPLCFKNAVITPSKTELDLSIGESARNTYTCPDFYLDRHAPVYTYSSSDPAVASVSSDGNITAKGYGMATINVVTTDGIAKGNFKVNVTAKGLSTSLDNGYTVKRASKVFYNDRANFSVTYDNGNVADIRDDDVKITSSDDSIISIHGFTVSKNGGYIDLEPKNFGTVTITVSVKNNITGNKILTKAFEVKVEDASIQITAVPSSNIEVGAVHDLNPRDIDGNRVILKTYTSSDPSVATVDSTGKITGVSEGNVTITVANEADSYSMNITVSPKTQEIPDDPESDDPIFTVKSERLSLHPGDTYELEPVDEKGNKVIITNSYSTDEEVATVSPSGTVTVHAKSADACHLYIGNNSTMIDVFVEVLPKVEVQPSIQPSVAPSTSPSVKPSVLPSVNPVPSVKPSVSPSVKPSAEPTIETKQIKTLSLSDTVKTYTSFAAKPTVKVFDANGTAVPSSGYSISYSSNVNAGKAIVTVVGKGKYTGVLTGAFIIKPAKTYGLSSSNVKTTSFKVKWLNKTGTSTYQVQYATNSSFTKNKKTVSVTGSAKTIKSLKKKTTYYVRVRGYVKVGNKTYYGKWSSKKKIKTAK